MTNTSFTQISHVTQPSLLGRSWAALTGALAAIDRERRIWSTVNRLNRLNDHTLRDVGLSRDQIGRVIREQSNGR